MSAETIRDHFVKFLGLDVGVSFVDADNPNQVILYRPDRLSNEFVGQAYEAFAKSHPKVANDIERVVVSFETRDGRTQRGVDIPREEQRFPTTALRVPAS